MNISINRIVQKRDMLLQQQADLKSMIFECKREYEVLTDQYMNGDIIWDIGKEQRMIKREESKYTRKLQKVELELRKLNQKYGHYFQCY